MYINYMIEQNKNTYVAYWILLITILVGAMIVVGGLTRLTDSGLSITKWDLFTGIVPPTNIKEWEFTFSLYKKIPEFQLLNSSMTLQEFKTIFWWEYIHRLLGRIVGLFFLIPLVYFSIKKMIKKKDLINFYLIFFLICFQGFIGWYMVKSGLSERTDVSHYRLSIHLTVAFIIFIFLILNFLKFKNLDLSLVGKKFPNKLLYLFLFLLLIQISIGAFVSGLDAGKIYQTWPLMNESYFPDDSNFVEIFSLKSFETPSLVQFMHRNIAYLIIFFFLAILFKIYKNKDYHYLRKSALVILLALVLQIILGILAVTSGAQIVIASMHQIGSIFLITATIILTFKNSKVN